MAKSIKLPISLVILCAASDRERAQRCELSVPWVSEVKVVTPQGPVHDFAQARNKAIQGVKFPWVLMLDADEEMAKIDLTALQQVIGNEQIAAVQFQRRDVFLGRALRWGEVRNIRTVRLFRHQHVTFRRQVHEVPVITGAVFHSPWIIVHTAHASLAHFWQKMTQYVEIETALRMEEGHGFSWLELVFWPVGKFIYNYVILLGFLDGWRGLCYALVMSMHSLGIRLRLYEIANTGNTSAQEST